ncbi:hypothetical protein BPAE_0575g00020 [Botrytis paeoniae]|uniref:Rhodopsin domain-containing protein n=1 Tax=Botrytis paeoniae TaxID=278948 RepID=A0A4Z1ESU3_9HELO|nr:hypothetical protein BPAE_0575g00020 [Botrytis paeoniae]
MDPSALDPNTTPLSLNPSGAPPNFTDPDTLAPTTLATGILFIILSSICVATRIYDTRKSLGKLRIDDYCVIIGQITAIAYWGLIYSLAVDGFARHSWDVPISFLNSSFTSRQFASQLLGSVVRLSVTAAIIILYMRLFSVLKWVRISCYCLFVFTFLIQVENVSIALYWYIPRPSDASHVASALARVTDTASSAIANAAATTTLDIILFLIPFVVVSSLNMSRNRRHACYLVFFFGILIIVADIVGLVYKTIGVVREIGDPFWIGEILIIILNVESFTLIIIACGPAISNFYVGTFTKSQIYSFLQYSKERLRSSTDRSKSHSTATPIGNSNSYKQEPAFPEWRNYQEGSTKSLVVQNGNYVELEPRKLSKTSNHTTLGQQEAGQMDGTSWKNPF